MNRDDEYRGPPAESELTTWVLNARRIADSAAPDVRVKALRDATEAFYDACKFTNVQITPAERQTLTEALTLLDNLHRSTVALLHCTPEAPAGQAYLALPTAGSSHAPDPDPSPTDGYWTPERKKNAIPAPMPRQYPDGRVEFGDGRVRYRDGRVVSPPAQPKPRGASGWTSK